jgi:site-specific DNA recombinase
LPNVTDAETQTLSVPVKLRRCGREIRTLDRTDPLATAQPDMRLIKLLIRARRFTSMPPSPPATGVSFAACAKQEERQPILFHAACPPQLSRPDITGAILDGRQPPDLTADKLLVHSRLPLARSDQRIALGFA